MFNTSIHYQLLLLYLTTREYFLNDFNLYQSRTEAHSKLPVHVYWLSVSTKYYIEKYTQRSTSI